MSRTKVWPVRAMYLLIAAALVISMIITAAPARIATAAPAAVRSEWSSVPTPSMRDWVLAPNSSITSFATARGGDVAYAVINSTWLLESADGAATWKNITGAVDTMVRRVTHTPVGIVTPPYMLLDVATDGIAADFVIVTLDILNVTAGRGLRVFVSNDGGATFRDTGEIRPWLNRTHFFSAAVSVEGRDRVRNIAIAGTFNGTAVLFRSEVIGGWAGRWDDATAYAGWNNLWPAIPAIHAAENITSAAVLAIRFSPNWLGDMTVLAVTTNGTAVHLQVGTWADGEGAWNRRSLTIGYPAVTVIANVTVPWGALREFTAGITLPANFFGTRRDYRFAWVWVNYNTTIPPVRAIGKIFLVHDALPVRPVFQQIPGNPWLTSVSYWGTVATGKAIAGVLGDGDPAGGLVTAECTGVQVFRTGGIARMDICCPPAWTPAADGKLPSGRHAMAVSYVRADKAYAVALPIPLLGHPFLGVPGTEVFDESAWSVSFDDGETWNQLSLIDTWIDYLSDVAVSPDCDTMILVSVNLRLGSLCDSVWLRGVLRNATAEYSGKWLRTWYGRLAGNNTLPAFPGLPVHPERGLLRLAPEETRDIRTVYLVDRMSSDVYRNDLGTLGRWVSVPSRITHIVDLAVSNATTIYALGAAGGVSKFDGLRWHGVVRSAVDEGWTIAVHSKNVTTHVLVGGRRGDVSHSRDGGRTFTSLERTPSIGGLVSVAFDTYFDRNSVVYAATALAPRNDVYRWVIGRDTRWEPLRAEPTWAEIGISPPPPAPARPTVHFTGIVLDRPAPANPMTSPKTGGVLYASYYYIGEGTPAPRSGVARSLRPAEVIACPPCPEWDYLRIGLRPGEFFIMGPQALKICGCLDAATNTRLFAIAQGVPGYDMAEARHGTVWTFEDCYSKTAPAVTYPAAGAIMRADFPFTLRWSALCDACDYDVQIAWDRDFTRLVTPYTLHYTITALSHLVPAGRLLPEFTFYWRVRAHRADTGQVIHSWWSEPRRVTIAPTAGAARIDLLSPTLGATGVAIRDVAFSWNLLAPADRFDWVLSTNSDLTPHVERVLGLNVTAHKSRVTLAHNTTYFWQVTAYRGDVVISRSVIGTFTTVAKIPPPPPPVVPPTPFWVWVVIAIGTVLVIVVIVLIFRTRRV